MTAPNGGGYCDCGWCEAGFNLRKESDVVKSKGNLVHARELPITRATTVSDLFELIDLPYKITRGAQVSLVPQYGVFRPDACTPYVLRIEWRD